MSDDLTLRLHNLWAMLEEEGYYTKADTVQLAKSRIEELEAKRQEAFQMYVDANEARLDAEAKLAKAVETLKRYGGVMPVAFTPIQDGGYKARTTLAELTGGKDE